MSDLRWTVVIRLDVDNPPRDIIFDRDGSPHGGPVGVMYAEAHARPEGIPYTEARAREVFALMVVQWSSRSARYRIMLLRGSEEVDCAVVGGKAMN